MLNHKINKPQNVKPAAEFMHLCFYISSMLVKVYPN